MVVRPVEYELIWSWSSAQEQFFFLSSFPEKEIASQLFVKVSLKYVENNSLEKLDQIVFKRFFCLHHVFLYFYLLLINITEAIFYFPAL